MKKPVLVIMAAGMGSRYGGLKQIDPVDADGHIIMDFSIYDAVKAGFEKVIFIIKKENEKDFKETIGNRMEQRIMLSRRWKICRRASRCRKAGGSPGERLMRCCPVCRWWTVPLPSSTRMITTDSRRFR